MRFTVRSIWSPHFEAIWIAPSAEALRDYMPSENHKRLIRLQPEELRIFRWLARDHKTSKVTDRWAFSVSE